VREQRRSAVSVAAITAAIRECFADSEVPEPAYAHLIAQMPGNDPDEGCTWPPARDDRDLEPGRLPPPNHWPPTEWRDAGSDLDNPALPSMTAAPGTEITIRDVDPTAGDKSPVDPRLRHTDHGSGILDLPRSRPRSRAARSRPLRLGFRFGWS
jgi:hypothetical protein